MTSVSAFRSDVAAYDTVVAGAPVPASRRRVDTVRHHACSGFLA